mgnify:CR=1 FL=1
MSAFEYDSAEQRRILGVFRDLIRARELLRDLVWKDLRVRYRYAVLGFLWAVVEPLALMLVLTFIFTFVFQAKAKLLGADEARPYAVTLLCGLIFWQYLATAVSGATQSLVDNQNLVKKVHFAREAVPLAAVLFPLVNLGIGAAALAVLHLALGGGLDGELLWVPIVFAVQLALAAGLALLFSCGHVHFRDVGNMVAVALTFGFYASPVLYELDFVRAAALSEGVPDWLATAYLANPMAGIIACYRGALFEELAFEPALLAWPTLCAALCLAAGGAVFRRAGPTLSDYL